MKLAEYLFSRLRQLGVDSMHGVPGDFNLELLDYVEPSGLRWVGNANELNAAYAADGYARIKGLGALITTFGVGELSAINAIAGAFAERAPVVHIVGVPSRESQDSRLLIHHTFNDGEYRRFAQMSSHVTVAQTRLWDPRSSPQQIDEVLSQCLLHSRPVYIEFPVDLVSAVVPDDRLNTPIAIPDTPAGAAQEEVLARIINEIYRAKRPIIFVDGETRALGIVDEVQKLSEITNWPTWTTSFGKGLLDETRPNFHGIYRGQFDEPAVQTFVNEADLVLCFGPHFSSTNTFGYSSIPRAAVTVLVTDTEVKFNKEAFRDVSAKYVASQLVRKLDPAKARKYESYPALPRDPPLSLSEASGDGPLTQDRLWRIVNNFLRPGDIVLGETGTAGYAVREMVLPKHARAFTPATWLSIGYMLPGSQGAALAQRELVESSKYFGIQEARTVLFIGDGSLQMTVQELATIIRHNLNVVVFVINNDGYTIERCIHGRKQGYNDVGHWRYLQAPSFFGAGEDTYTATAKTWSELGAILGQDKLNNGEGLKMIELIVEREDTPRGILTHMMEAQRARDGLA